MQVDTSLHMVDIFISKNNYEGILTPEIAKVNYHIKEKKHIFSCAFSLWKILLDRVRLTQRIIRHIYYKPKILKSELYKRKKMHFCISSLKKKGVKIGSELLRLIEVGASCFNHYCVGYDVTQLNVLHNVHRRISLG